MKKKVVSILLTATMAVGMLAGCGGSGSVQHIISWFIRQQRCIISVIIISNFAPAEDAEAEVVQGTTGSGSTKTYSTVRGTSTDRECFRHEMAR